MAENLTEKQRRFVEAYMGQAAGNATEAARLAGYKQAHSQGPRLLENVGVAAALAERQKNDPAVATREERQAFWTAVMRGEHGGASMSDRLRASELLGKTGGDFGPNGSEGNPLHLAAIQINIVNQPVEVHVGSGG